MPGFATRDYVGNQPITSFWALDTVLMGGQPVIPQGIIVAADDLYWGGGEFMFVKANGTIRQFGLCVVNPTFNSTLGQWEYLATEVPATANLGRTLGVAMRAATTGQFLWLSVAGLTPLSVNASVAADTTFGIGAAGQGGANVAGRQVLNARSAAPSTTTVVKQGQAASGSTLLTVSDASGWFPGIALSGTGIAGGTTVTSVDVNNRTITLSAATTAAVNGAVTGTYTGFIVAYLNRPFAQGAIT
jgi:hypothetical protein